jgi:hypothetical protein
MNVVIIDGDVPYPATSGKRLRPGQDYTPADTTAEMAEALTEALRHPGPAIARAEHARQTAGRYDWPELAGRLERVWEQAV